MYTRDPVKIPDLPGKISFTKANETEYVRYQTERPYNPERKYTEPERVVIGKRIETMPGLMYPNDNYEKYFDEKGEQDMETAMNPEERDFTEKNKIYGMYLPFFDALYYEFKQQTRKRPDERLSHCKAECLNRVLGPLKNMMKDEEYADLLPSIGSDADGEDGMSCSDVMIILTQYKSALEKYHKTHK